MSRPPSQSELAIPTIKTVLKPILYADIFDFPLTFEEVYQYIDIETTPEEVRCLLNEAIEAGLIEQLHGYYSLPDRMYLVDKRRQRQIASDKLWVQARHFGYWLGALPFIRMVAVTGSLAVDNPRDGVDDIDYLIVTRPGRLWFCRALIILMVRYGHLRGTHLCPNYLITENKLSFDSIDFFTAREMVQMKLVYGTKFYQKMWQANDWVIQYFPQGKGPEPDTSNDTLSSTQQLLKKLGEFVFGGFLGNLLETGLRKYQINKHTRLANQNGTHDTLVFTADVCKGHYDGHKHKTMQAYRQRAEKYNLSLENE
ncbi:MAG: hypothetical protein KDJ52_19555 [Anaerolineae bacterium]|nr:hypothetical protein [Anaerolineae bacterium]